MKKTVRFSTALCASMALYCQAASAQSALEEAPDPPTGIVPDQTIGSQFSGDADAEIIVEEGTLVVPTPFFPGFDFGVYIDGPNSRIVLEDGAQVSAETAFGFGLVSTSGGGTITISGDVIATGFQGGGVFVQAGAPNIVNLTQTGVVFTSGFQAAGIQAFGSGDVVNIAGRVQTQGIEASGVLVGRGDGIRVNIGATGQVLVEGDFTPGLSTIVNGNERDIRFDNAGLVQSFGNAGPGIVLGIPGSSAQNSGVVATLGDGSPGVLMLQSNVSLANSGTILTSGGTFDANIEELVGLVTAGTGVTATTVPSAGVFIANGGIQVTNIGSITATNGPGIFTSADFAAVTNAAPTGAGDVSLPISIINTESGRIEGGTAAIQGSALIEQVSNSGTIVGDVLLDEGDDSFTLALATGSVDGIIDGGGGADALILSGNGEFNGATQRGFESLTLTGTGDQILSGNFGVFETLVANAGVSAILGDDGTIVVASGATFDAGSALRGTGTIGGDVTSGGVIDPGGAGSAAPGTLTIGGDLALTDGSSLVIGLNSGIADRLVVGGSAVIAGTIAIAAEPGTNFGLFPDSIVVVQTGAGVTASTLQAQTFNEGVLTLIATPTISGNDLVLGLSVTSGFADIPGLDANGSAVGRGLDASFAASPATSDFRAALGVLSPVASAAIYDSLSPEFYDAATRAGVLIADRGAEMVFDRIAANGTDRKAGLWAALSTQSFDRGGADVFGYEIDQINAAVGFDFKLGTLVAGLAGTYGDADLEVLSNAGADAGGVDALGLMAYISTANAAGFNLAATAGYHFVDAETQRSTNLSGIDGTFGADFGRNVFGAELQGSYTLPLGKKLSLTTGLGLDFLAMESEAFDEAGTGEFALSVNSRSYEEIGGTAALDLIGQFGNSNARIQPFLGGFVRRVLSDAPPQFIGSFLATPAASFTVAGSLDRTEYGLNAGIGATILDGGATISVGYRGRFSDNNNSHQGAIQLFVPM
ncbi:MAG: autotransporter domain-containing protein [Erythrobacter sp.]